MVDRSNLVIAVFNGQKSGTKNTVDYAIKKGININNVKSFDKIIFNHTEYLIVFCIFLYLFVLFFIFIR